MKRKIITIENGVVSVPQSAEIKMSVSEIAFLFDVYEREIYSNVKAVMKQGLIHVNVSVPAVVSGNSVIPDVYGLDMITALAFRIRSHKAEVFRKWLMKKIIANSSGQQILMNILWNDRALLN
jgi:hypothetical protein